MQLFDQANRLNRVPRIHPQHLGLCRRLHLRVRLFSARLKLNELCCALRELEHNMALDKAAADAHRIQYLKCPVLRSRIAEDELVRAGLLRALDQAKTNVEAIQQELAS